MNNPKVLIICSLAYSLINFRKDFIEELLKNGYEVYCAGPDYDADVRGQLEAMGCQTVDFHLQRKGLNPLKDFKTVVELERIIHRLKIDFVFAYTIKPVVYGSFAAKRAGVPMFSLITGLGFTFSGVSAKARLLGKVSSWLYKRALKSNAAVIFQNHDDKALFLDGRILSKNQNAYVVNGSGIHLDRFRYKESHEFNSDGVVNFIIVGRLMKEKGVDLFLKVAQEVFDGKGNAKFHLVGEPPAGMDAMEAKLKELHRSGVIQYHQVQKDVRPFLYDADVFVLPTYYREGVPRSILEALAVGMPIITTDTPGCKETVEEGKNGFLIAPQEYRPLMDAVRFFMKHPEKIEPMGRQSRKLAEDKFDVHLINADLLRIIKQHGQ